MVDVGEERFMALACKEAVAVEGDGGMGALDLKLIFLLNNLSALVQELI